MQHTNSELYDDLYDCYHSRGNDRPLVWARKQYVLDRRRAIATTIFFAIIVSVATYAVVTSNKSTDPHLCKPVSVVYRETPAVSGQCIDGPHVSQCRQCVTTWPRTCCSNTTSPTCLWLNVIYILDNATTTGVHSMDVDCGVDANCQQRYRNITSQTTTCNSNLGLQPPTPSESLSAIVLGYIIFTFLTLFWLLQMFYMWTSYKRYKRIQKWVNNNSRSGEMFTHRQVSTPNEILI